MQFDRRAIAGPALAAMTALGAVLIDGHVYGIPNPAPLLVCIVWLGVYPAPVLRRMEASAERLVHTVQAGAAAQGAPQTALLPAGE